MTGRMYNEAWGRVGALLIFLGFNVTFFPQFLLGYLGMPRRYHQYPPEFQLLNILSSARLHDPSGRVFFSDDLPVWSLWFGKRASANPWRRRVWSGRRARRRRRITSWPSRWSISSPTTTRSRRASVSESLVRGGMSAVGVSPVGVELHEQFNNTAQQRHAATMGMFIWLITELLLFAGLFLVALILRITHPASVTAAAKHSQVLDRRHQYRHPDLLVADDVGRDRVIAARLAARDGALYAGDGIPRLAVHRAQGLRVRRRLARAHVPFFLDRSYALAGDSASELFVNLYFATTGLHGLHLITGVSILLVLTRQAAAPGYLQRHQNRIEIYGSTGTSST